MATSSMPNSDRPAALQGRARAGERTLWDQTVLLLQPFASLKVTVVMLALSIALVFIGTLAQVDQDMWDVIAAYFDAWFCKVKFQVFFPRSWFPQAQNVPGWFPFVGGKTIGLVMLVNLFTAHLIRFKVQAKRSEIGLGLGLLAVGVGVTAAVIMAGQSGGGLQGKAPLAWRDMWTLTLVGAALLSIAGLVASFIVQFPSRATRIGAIATASTITVGSLLLWLVRDSLYLGDAGMRILWQLAQAEFASLWLLGAFIVLFRKRAGVTLIHAGIGLLMLGQLLVNLFAVEERMTIREGESIDYVLDIRGVELAVLDKSDAERDHVAVVPLVEKGTATRYLDDKAKVELSDARWPFTLEVVKFLKNSGPLRPLDKGETAPGTAGLGAKYTVDEQRKAAGADSDGAVDTAAAWVKVTGKDGGDLGTYLLSQQLTSANRFEPFKVGDREFELSLRFKRTYKPYSFTLVDVRKDDYAGTSIAKNYSSDVKVKDERSGFEEDVKIRMNEPLRYSGETFYQSSYKMIGANEATELQVVTNTGWMIPYVSCMIVLTGMIAHFGLVLMRFVERLTRAPATAEAKVVGEAAGTTKSESGPPKRRRATRDANDAATGPSSGRYAEFLREHAVPLVVAAVVLVLVSGLMRKPKAPLGKFDYYAFGQIPVLEKGRVKPLDTLARNSLRVITNRESLKDHDDPKQTIQAIEWLAEVVADTDRANDFQVFRIENQQVLDLLELPRRKNLRYSVNELSKKIDSFETAIDGVRKKQKDEWSVYERKLVELDGRIRTFTLLKAAFRPLPIPPIPTEEEFNKDRAGAERRAMQIRQMLMTIPERDRQLAEMQPTRAIPVAEDRNRGSTDEEAANRDKWVPYATAWNRAYLASIMNVGQRADAATTGFSEVLDAYSRGEPERFNKAVTDYRKLVDEMKPDLYSAGRTTFETWFNHFSPFFYMIWFYVLAFVVTCFGWLATMFGKSRTIHWSAFAMVVCTFLVHTFALAARIYISGRPPVTNLYSSAIFIGWGCVVAGIVLELFLKQGIGNTVASFAGGATLGIAYFLALDGDTVAVMVAVLDTQFWLSTHVVCISLGYTATFVAGLLGLVYVFGNLVRGAMEKVVTRIGSTDYTLGKLMATAIYGVLCFAILFSFVGTVLGGLWADDSWGRFWGWDPKENGALIIVLWNALILHARWDGLVRERGLAVLAIGGNIVTSWSWFGVNELGVGLHSYGFTEGVLLYLSLTIVAHLVAIGLAFVPSLLGRGKQTPASAA